jgi:ribA/ribD-fused uncharacterized protein
MKIKMDHCSYFIKDRAMFGSFPNQESVIELENIGVRYFINLTFNEENKLTPYITKYNYIHYPIVDRKAPTNWQEFAKFILTISNIIKNLSEKELLYLHCKGGHGRSGVVVACILCYMFNLTPEVALDSTTKYHSNRSIMRDKWRKLGSPQTYSQKNFVLKFFEPLHFYKAHKTGNTVGFSNFSLHPVNIPEIGIFPTSEAAFQAYKDITNVDYVNKLINTKTPNAAKFLGNTINVDSSWYDYQDNIMKKILKYKFEQNLDIRERLINTGLRPIIEHNCEDVNNLEQNKLGKMLSELRNNIYLSM